MTKNSVEPRTRKYVKGYGFLTFARKKTIKNNYKKQLLDTEINASKKVIHKSVKATGEFLGNKITNVATKSNDNSKTCN